MDQDSVVRLNKKSFFFGETTDNELKPSQTITKLLEIN
jgi:hypothetical protein